MVVALTPRTGPQNGSGSIHGVVDTLSFHVTIVIGVESGLVDRVTLGTFLFEGCGY